jgi:hypothetical protein
MLYKIKAETRVSHYQEQYIITVIIFILKQAQTLQRSNITCIKLQYNRITNKNAEQADKASSNMKYVHTKY